MRYVARWQRRTFYFDDQATSAPPPVRAIVVQEVGWGPHVKVWCRDVAGARLLARWFRKMRSGGLRRVPAEEARTFQFVRVVRVRAVEEESASRRS